MSITAIVLIDFFWYTEQVQNMEKGGSRFWFFWFLENNQKCCLFDLDEDCVIHQNEVRNPKNVDFFLDFAPNVEVCRIQKKNGFQFLTGWYCTLTLFQLPRLKLKSSKVM